MKANDVPRFGRVLDLIGLLLFVVGGGVFVRAWLGFEGVRHYQPGPHEPLWSAMHRANGFLRLQHIGGAIMAAVLVMVAAVLGLISRQKVTPA